MDASERERKFDEIKKFVAKRRKIEKIDKLSGPLPELSGEMFGEYYSLLWRVLLHTPEDEWHTHGLDNDKILDGVHVEVLRSSL